MFLNVEFTGLLLLEYQMVKYWVPWLYQSLINLRAREALQIFLQLLYFHLKTIFSRYKFTSTFIQLYMIFFYPNHTYDIKHQFTTNTKSKLYLLVSRLKKNSSHALETSSREEVKLFRAHKYVINGIKIFKFFFPSRLSHSLSLRSK